MHRALSAIITNPQPNHPRYLTKYPPVLFESRCSINPSFIRMAKCLPIAATLLPYISAIPLRWMPGFKRIIVYVAITLSFSVSFIVSFIVSLASLFLLLRTGSTNSTSSTSILFYSSRVPLRTSYQTRRMFIGQIRKQFDWVNHSIIEKCLMVA